MIRDISGLVVARLTQVHFSIHDSHQMETIVIKTAPPRAPTCFVYLLTKWCNEQGGRRAVVSNFRAVWPRNSFTRMPECSKLYLQTLSGTAVKPLGVTISVSARHYAVLMAWVLLISNCQPLGICVQVLEVVRSHAPNRQDFGMVSQ
jgi:hypothetical protein